MAEKVLAVGFFDGVHLGHQAILTGADAALTFSRHPRAVLSPDRAPRLIMTLDDRLSAIRACGVSEVRVLDFTPELASTPAENFLLNFTGWRVRCGANWRFGAKGAGDADLLRRHGIAVEVVGYADFEGAPVSSSRIREALERGDVVGANAMLGRRFAVRGVFSRGKGEGARLGFPTLNFRLDGLELRLPNGVYEVAVGGCRGLANYGTAPTFGARAWFAPVLEVHLLATLPASLAALQEGDCRPVEFVRFLRPERAFATLADLKAQIARDIAFVQG